jgi:hypothetical protein
MSASGAWVVVVVLLFLLLLLFVAYKFWSMKKGTSAAVTHTHCPPGCTESMYFPPEPEMDMDSEAEEVGGGAGAGHGPAYYGDDERIGLESAGQGMYGGYPYAADYVPEAAGPDQEVRDPAGPREGPSDWGASGERGLLVGDHGRNVHGHVPEVGGKYSHMYQYDTSS